MATSYGRPWESRMQALQAVAADMQQHYSKVDDRLTGKPDVRLQMLSQVLERLAFFAKDMFQFFSLNMTPPGSSGSQPLEYSKEHPPTQVLSLIVEQMGYDLEVIQRAAEQRLFSTPLVVTKLEEADYLANKLIDHARSAGLLDEDTRAVTYFQKSPAIRVIPYADLALIGIPYTVCDEPRDLLTIPHEIGHYVFWHGYATPPDPERPEENKKRRFLYQDLMDQALKTLAAMIDIHHPELDVWSYLWLEELFADVFGCWMSGPAMALTAHDVARAHSQSTFVADDDKHPVPLVRPFICMKALHARDQHKWPKSLKLLRDEWDKEKRRGKDEFKLPDGREVNILDVMTVGWTTSPTEQPVDSVIAQIVRYLEPFGLPMDDWFGSTTKPAVDTDLLPDFENQYDEYERAQQAPSHNFRPAAVTWTIPNLTFAAYATQRFQWPVAGSLNPNVQDRFDLKRLLDGTAKNFTIRTKTWWPLVQMRDWTLGPADVPWPHG